MYRFYAWYYIENGLFDRIGELEYAIDDAIKDITSYDAALQLTEHIKKMAQKEKEYKTNDTITNFAPGFYNKWSEHKKMWDTVTRGRHAIELDGIVVEHRMSIHISIGITVYGINTVSITKKKIR